MHNGKPEAAAKLGQFGDAEFDEQYKRDDDWFSSYISHLRKRRRKAVKGSGLAAGSDSDDESYFRTPMGTQPKRKTFYEKQQDKKALTKAGEAPDKYWTYFRNMEGGKEGPSPNERRAVEKSRQELNREKEEFYRNTPKHSHKDLYGADEYYRAGRDVLYRIWQERENLKEKDKQLKHELGYDEREMEYGVPGVVAASREYTSRYEAPIHNPNSQQLVRTMTQAHSTAPAGNRSAFTATAGGNQSRYSVPPTGGAPSEPVYGRGDRSLATNQRPFDLPPQESDRENIPAESMVRSETILKEKIDTQSRKVENLYDTIRSLEREKAQQEAVIQDMREDVRSMKERLDTRQDLSRQSQDSGSKQLEAFRREFADSFSKIQSQINSINNQQHKSSKSEDMISTLVGDIGDIKKMFREEVQGLKQEMESLKGQTRRMASEFENNSSQIKEIVRRVDRVDQRCEEIADSSTRKVREALSHSAVATTADQQTKQSFEIQDLRTALLDLGDRMKHVETTATHTQKALDEQRLAVGTTGCGDKPKSHSSVESFTRVSSEGGAAANKRHSDDHSSKASSSRWAVEPLTRDEDLELTGHSSVATDEKDEPTLVTEDEEDRNAADELLILTEEIDDFGLTASGEGSLDDLSTF